MTKLYAALTFYQVTPVASYREDLESDRVEVAGIDGTVISEKFGESLLPAAMHKFRQLMRAKGIDPDIILTDLVLVRHHDGSGFARFVFKSEFEAANFTPVPEQPA